MTYAIVKLGGKQYRVQEGEKLLVDRLAVEENETFHPEVLFVGGDGQAELAPRGVQVTAKVVGHVLGDKIRIGKYKKRTGYKRHTGFRAKLSQVQIEAIAKKAARAAAKPAASEEAPGPTARKPKQAAEPKQEAAAQPETGAQPETETTSKPRKTAKKPATPRKKAE